MHFGNLCFLNLDWITEQKANLFSQKNISVWNAAFGSYIQYNQPHKFVFDVLREEFYFSLEHLSEALVLCDDNKTFVDRLGQHLFTYYLWNEYSLKDSDSLLARFYDKTHDDNTYWANLFDHVGRSLSQSGTHLDRNLIERITSFFDWRYSHKEPSELLNFTFWLEAECLDPEWRLQSYLKILDLDCEKDVGISIELRALNKLLPDYVGLVVECFAKITDGLNQDSQIYISADEAKPILTAGLNAEGKVKDNAERARESLLKLGRFDYLNLN